MVYMDGRHNLTELVIIIRFNDMLQQNHILVDNKIII